MTSKIVVSNNISENEKLKSLALLNEPSFDLRFMSPYYLAEYLLQLSGISYSETFVKNDRLSAYLYQDIRNIGYFSKFSYNDILGLIETIQDVRYHIINQEDETFIEKLPVDQFIKKNQAIKQAYELIKNYLKDNNLIDEVGVIRFALKHASPIKDIEIVKYELSHLRPLENYLIDFASGHKVNESKICPTDKPLRIEKYTKAFGQSNEIEDIISFIYKYNLSFDDCVIASADGVNYANILNNYKDLLNLPVTIGLGKKLTETNPGKLFFSLVELEDNLYHKVYWKDIFSSDAFNVEQFKLDIQFPLDLEELNTDLPRKEQISFEKLIDLVGDLKLSFDVNLNNKKISDYETLLNKYTLDKYNEKNTLMRVRTLPYLKSIADILSKGKIYFLNQYTFLKDLKVDQCALDKVVLMLSFAKYGVSHVDIINQIKMEKTSRETPQKGTLYFTTISKALSCLRKNLFIVGLSSSNFPGKNTENPFILDRDYQAFGELENSTREIRNNKDDYFALLEAAKKHNVHVCLSWASYNEETLKSQNSSSVVFETYKLENGNDKTINDFENEFINNSAKYRYIEYFDHDLLPMNIIGKAIVEDKEINYLELEEKSDEDLSVPVNEMLGDHAFSASAVTNYAKCPYLFYLQNILGLESERELDLTEIIPANDSGTLAHDLLEHLDKKAIDKKTFLTRANQRFNEYLIFHPTENLSLAELARKDFVEMMENAYDMESDIEVETAEKDYYCTHYESGVRIHGLPDKIYRLKNNHFVVVDYKTGSRVKHDVTDPASMVQCTIYSYIFEHYKKYSVVDGFEYRYIKTGDRVFSGDLNYTMTDHYNNLTEILRNLKKSLETGDFEPNNKYCSDCYMRDKCRRKK